MPLSSACSPSPASGTSCSAISPADLFSPSRVASKPATRGRFIPAIIAHWPNSFPIRTTLCQAVEQCRKALQLNPKDQTAVYHLIVGLRKTSQTAEVPELLKRLAALREQEAKEQSRRYRYKLVEDETAAKPANLR
jgi:hypothetical protein